jgi:hypothetical protein
MVVGDGSQPGVFAGKDMGEGCFGSFRQYGYVPVGVAGEEDGAMAFRLDEYRQPVSYFVEQPVGGVV